LAGEPEQKSFFSVATDDLNAHGEPGGGPRRREADCRLPGSVEDVAEGRKAARTSPDGLRIDHVAVQIPDRWGHGGERWREEQVVVLKKRPDLARHPVQYVAGAN
jgi:hypothetical protein